MNFKRPPITYCMKNFKWLTKTFASLCAVAIVSTTFAADNPRDPGVNARQRAQRKRINEGVRSGELTRDEAVKLRQEQRAIRTEKRAYKADGKVTAAERKDLHQDLNAASKDIYQEKHDADTRPAVKPLLSPKAAAK